MDQEVDQKTLLEMKLASGNRTSKIHDDLAADALDRAYSYIYDPNDRLTQERIMNATSLTGNIASTTLYEYGTLTAGGTLTPGSTLARATKYQGTNTTPAGTKLSRTEYRYDVAGKTAEVKVDSFGTSPTSTTTQFTYDQAGSYERQLHTKAGEVTLKVPRLRRLAFETQIIERADCRLACKQQGGAASRDERGSGFGGDLLGGRERSQSRG